MRVPVFPARGIQLVERLEERELHVRVQPVNEPDSPVTEVEDDRILVGLTVGTDHATGVPVELEPPVHVDQAVDAHLPRPARFGVGQMRVRHHDVVRPTASHTLDARVLDAEDVVGRAGREHSLELVLAPVPGLEHEHVGDVVQESRPRTGIQPIAGTDAACEEVEGAVDVSQACVEDRPVALDGSCLDDRRPLKAPDGAGPDVTTLTHLHMHYRTLRTTLDLP
jgi:hypothetical protein